MSQAELNSWKVIRLLTWKNLIVFRERHASFFFSILSPATFLAILVFLKFSLRMVSMPEKVYDLIDLEPQWRELKERFSHDAEVLKNKTNGSFNYNCFIPQKILAYAPDRNLPLMESVAKHLNIETISYKDSRSLREAMMKHHYLAGVDFTAGQPTFKYTLIFPSEVRFYDDNIIGSNWRTNNLYDPYYRYMQRFPLAEDGGYVGYIREGFLAIQHAIFLAIASSVTNNKFQESRGNILMRRFPVPYFWIDPFLDRIRFCLSLAILVGFLYPTIDLVKNIVTEKNLLLKDALNIFGISETVQFITWFIRGLVPFSIASLISVAFFKISWTNHGIFNKSSWTAIMCFMLTYNLASICFCYLISTFSQDPPTAAMIQSVAWIFTYFPYVVLVQIGNDNTLTTILVCLFSNTAMALGVNQMLDFEKFGEGFHWTTQLDTNNLEGPNMAVGSVMLILLGQALVYTLIGIAIEKTIKKKWRNALISCLGLKRLYLRLKNYSISKLQRENGSRDNSFEMRRKLSADIGRRKKSSSFSKPRIETEIIEIAGSNKAVLVEIKNLCKTGSDNVKIIDNVSMDLYEGEITVLMGANGSGKSLLMSMIVGHSSATSGTVLINGINITKYGQLDHTAVGASLNEDMLFPDLTVYEQLTFFCRMRGYSGDKLESNVEKYLNALNLSNKDNIVTHKLTHGAKRHLCVCCALCGHSKFVIIDEPSTGMDVSGRKLLWDLLLKEKQNRTILISTQSTEEAEVIADRIGIMSQGKLKCFGSIYFLKSLYGAGKRLTCTRSGDCHVNTVTKFIRQYIPDIKPHSNIGTELSYIISQDNIKVLVSVLSAIEDNRKKLKLHSIAIADLPFDDLFLSMSEDDAEMSDRERITHLLSGFSIYVEEYDTLYFLQRDKNKHSVIKQLKAMFLKRWYYLKRNAMLTVLQFGLPISIAYLSFLIYYSTTREPLQEITFQLNQYTKSITTIRYSDDKNIKKIAEKYYRFTEKMGSVHRYESLEKVHIEEYILNKTKTSKRLGSEYLIGVTLKKHYIVAWFNNYPLHTAPLSLNMAHNALLNMIQMSDMSINVTFDPLPFSTNFDPDSMIRNVALVNMLSFFFAFVMCCIYAMEISTLIAERKSMFKLLQYINGLRPTAYLIGNLAYNLVEGIFIGLVIVAIVAILYIDNLFTLELLVFFFITLVFFVFGISTFIYCLSKFFNDRLKGCIVILILNVYGAVLYVSLMELQEERFIQAITMKDRYIWLFQIFPIFAFCSSLNKIIGALTIRRICLDENIYRMSVLLKKCTVNPNCCIHPNVLEWDNPYCIIPEMIYLLSVGVTCMIIFGLMEYDKHLRVSSRIKKKIYSIVSQPSPNVDERKDNDLVEQEKEIVRKYNSSQYKTKSLVINNVSMSLAEGIAINHIYLQIPPGECVGLLGANNSGKATIIKLLTGHEIVTDGEIYVKGIRMKTNLSEMYKHCGVCPEPYALPYTFQVDEIMKIMCILRGIPAKSIYMTCANLAKVLGFFGNLFEVYGKLSSGYQLRVCAAVSMIGSPSMVYFNEVTPGIDPAGRRQLWNIICRMCKMGTSVLFPSVDARECEHICTRLAIVENGSFSCLDTPHNLSEKYMKGYLLYVRIKHRDITKSFTSLASHWSHSNFSLEVPGSSTTNPFLKLQSFVDETFKNSIVMDERGHVIIFFIPGYEISMASIYMEMKTNAFNLNVETFSLTRNTLEMVFSDLVEANAKSGNII